MTTEEKLQHFYKISIESAEAEADKELTAYKEGLERIFQGHKDERVRQAEAELKVETESARRQMNKVLSAEQLQVKRILSERHNALKAKLFEEVEKSLADFKQRLEYQDYLVQKCNEALQFADGDEVRLLLSAEDAELVETISQRTGHPVECAEKSFGGGVKALIPARNVLMDHSFQTLLETEREAFTFKGGHPHE